jgi:hypothetical protein
LSAGFQVTPVVAASIGTENGGDAVDGRISDIGVNGFKYRMQEQESTKTEHAATEQVFFLAWEPSAGEVNGFRFEVGSTPDVVTHDVYDLAYDSTFTTMPYLIADMQTMDGADTANVRYRYYDEFGAGLYVCEDESKDSEVNHVSEVIGYMLFAPVQ